MNKDRILAIADQLERAERTREPGLGFNMNWYLATTGEPIDEFDGYISNIDPARSHLPLATGEHECGTVCCIAGWAVTNVYGVDGTIKRMINGMSVSERAADLLDLPDFEYHPDNLAYQLFVPDRDIHLPPGKKLDDITPMIAARCLRHLADTGEVDWYKAFEEETVA